MIVIRKIFGLMIFAVLFVVGYNQQLSFANDISFSEKETNNTANLDFDSLTAAKRYSNVLKKWQESGLVTIEDFHQTSKPENFTRNNNQLLSIDDAFGYDSEVIDFSNESITIDFFVVESGLYEIALDYYSTTDNILPITFSLKVNGKYQYNETKQMTLNTFWEDDEIGDTLDRYGNEILPQQSQLRFWKNAPMRDASRIIDGPLLFNFTSGHNTVTLTLDSGSMLLGNMYLKSPNSLQDYETYLSQYEDETIQNTLTMYQAEKILYKNSPSIRAGVSRDVGVTPKSINKMKINILDGTTFNTSGDTVHYEIDVETSGFYYLTFKVKQDVYANSPSYRQLKINNEIPFEEAKEIAFPYSTKWQNITIDYKIYLEKGVNTIALETNASPYYEVYESLQDIITEITFLSLDIKQLTGNNADRNRDWDVERFIPGVTDQLETWRQEIMSHIEALEAINQSAEGSRDIVFLKSAVDKLDRLLKDIDRIPYRLNILSEGSGSIAQLIGDAIGIMLEQPLSIDSFYVHGDVDLPKSEPNFFVKLWVGIQRFFLSFINNPYDDEAHPDEINIWVNRNRQIVDIMQEMADSQFTETTGVPVKFSLMPDESKLILANAANVGPDIAMGTHVNLAYNLALRDSVYDLTNFSDFDEFIELYKQPGALIPFVHDGGIYGLPETQNFNILFYRKDIFDAMGLQPPNTWDEALALLPDLQRFGMNFFIPLAYANSYKTTDTTVPFIYQFNGSLYEDSGLSTSIDYSDSIEAIEFMTDLFTVYGLPLQVPSFYHQFRYGTMPIGIGDFGVYVQLTHAAPEIKNMWGIHLIPGIEQEDGTINRDTTGVGHGMMILENSNKKDESWDFLKWWMQTDVQIEFEQTMTMTLGSEYMWNSANLEAFKQASWPEEDKLVLLEQWQHLRNVPNSPASYMLERELSNIWNNIVLSGKPVRDAVEESVLVINREMERKNYEFGYMDRYGNKISDYPIPTREWISEKGYLDED